ncbi:hypothetical protein H310_02315 [Aphanomyces invadans]|uniref:NADH dehydrogenase [ubiquinone] 1 alpha subcomplex subunit 11 n=1 Tax=Aphanomyces invadans TaxID=157072 RepID=A0A024UQ26_9STRA|nr:hypothetical protein H310_02315 [Aphanomyces invadans]ETW07907.1 hypothetical protein H310_02315 [Aphanomyces invadans]|eukprot:XP_008864000.1 hypothetical protein H310_02315 [Aphanomyces invadans]
MDSLNPGQKVALFTAAGAFGGAAVGSVESVWRIPRLGQELPSFAKQLRGIGGRSVAFGSASFLFAAGEHVAHSIRSNDDVWNPFIGGLVAGVVPAVVKQNALWGLGAGIAVGTTMAFAHYFESGDSNKTPLEKWASRYDYLKKD